MAIVSGRGLRDAQRKVAVPGLIYSGNHGLEIEWADGRLWVHPGARRLAKVIRRIGGEVSAGLGDFPGAQLEDKGLTLSLHFRNLKPFLSPRPLRELLTAAMGADAARLRLTRGKKVWELRPRVAWSKGDALLKLAGSRPIAEPWTIAFVGDDQTDEEGFRRLGLGALTVRVGRRKGSRARFWLKRQRQVGQFLEFIRREWCVPAPGSSKARR